MDKPKRLAELQANCPILVGHLNNLLDGTEAQKALAFQLIMMLDDIEGIAELMDHQFPAERHAMARTQNIEDCARRCRHLIVAIAFVKEGR
jgi:hypothetical protein